MSRGNSSVENMETVCRAQPFHSQEKKIWCLCVIGLNPSTKASSVCKTWATFHIGNARHRLRTDPEKWGIPDRPCSVNASSYIVGRSGKVAHRKVHICFLTHPIRFTVCPCPQVHIWHVCWRLVQCCGFCLTWSPSLTKATRWYEQLTFCWNAE